jgi:hypothetical protein
MFHSTAFNDERLLNSYFLRFILHVYLYGGMAGRPMNDDTGRIWKDAAMAQPRWFSANPRKTWAQAVAVQAVTQTEPLPNTSRTSLLGADDVGQCVLEPVLPSRAQFKLAELTACMVTGQVTRAPSATQQEGADVLCRKYSDAYKYIWTFE